MLKSSRFKSLLAAMRLPNLPGVASHVVTGGLVSIWLGWGATDVPQVADWWGLAIAAAAAVLLCLGGNVLNDWHDRDWDAEHRPERALPSGVFQPSTFFWIGSSCLLLVPLMMVVLDWRAALVAMAISACVLIYTRFHKCCCGSILPLAGCRGLLPLFGAFAVGGTAAEPVVIAHGAGLFLWTCGLSLDARGESGGARAARPGLAWILLLAAPLVTVWAVRATEPPPWSALVPSLLWLLMVRGPYRHHAKMRVSALLAGLPLVDFIVLASVWGTQAGLSPAFLWLPFLAFGLGRLAQRVVSAT